MSKDDTTAMLVNRFKPTEVEESEAKKIRRSQRWFVRPHSRLHRIWVKVLGIIVLIDCAMIPFEMAFGNNFSTGLQSLVCSTLR